MYMHQEIIEEIVFRLLVKTRVKFKSVRKSWNALISESQFSKMNLQQSIDTNRMKLAYLKHDTQTTLVYEVRMDRLMEEYHDDSNLNDVSVLACCNRLFCMSVFEEIFMWNSSTHLSRKISTLPVDFLTSFFMCASVFFGLIYHSTSNDYKLVRIVIFNDKDVFRTEVKIYSKNTDTWKRVEDFPYEFPLTRPGVYANGCLHWIISMWDDGALSHIVALLDLTNESYSLIRLYDLGSREYFFDIVSLKGKLNVFHSSNDNTSYIWILDEHDNAESWMRIKIVTDCISSLDVFIYFTPLCVLKPGKILIRIGSDKVVIFDVEKKCRTDVYLPNISDRKLI